MSEETQVLRTIDWRSVFPFTQLFRSFRIAIHPAKLALALAAILIVYTAGRTLDGLWDRDHLAVQDEVALFEPGSKTAFADAVAERRADANDNRARLATSLGVGGEGSAPSDGELKRLLRERREKAAQAANEAYEASGKTSADKTNRDTRVRSAYASAGRDWETVEAARGRGIFITFLDYEISQINAIAKGVVGWDWTGPGGVIYSIGRFVFTGPRWALTAHPLHTILMTLIALFTWSVFGGAIARIAAVHVSRDEKISVRQALRFSLDKLMSFFAAPVMPLLLIAVVGLILAVLGWLSHVPYLGGLVSMVIGLLFVVAIGIGVLLACALVCTVCGFGLMYPTIAVEGSDAFDAVSRSFSYVFARPWKIFIYTLIGIIYGALTYLLLRFMAYLTLALLHTFLTLWAHDVGPDGTTSIAHAWTGPLDTYHLTNEVDFFNLTLAEKIAAGLLSFWLYLFVSLLGAYLLSYFVSFSTIMYYLLRYDVDATGIDDVYLEPTEDEFEDTPDPAAGGSGAGASGATAGGGGSSAAPPMRSSVVPAEVPVVSAGPAALAGTAPPMDPVSRAVTTLTDSDPRPTSPPPASSTEAAPLANRPIEPPPPRAPQ